jgi:hypothetical protein
MKLLENDIVNHTIVTLSFIILYPILSILLFCYVIKTTWVENELRYSIEPSNKDMEVVGKWCGCEIKATQGLVDEYCKKAKTKSCGG